MTITIGMVSRLEQGKGQDTLIKAAALLKGKIPNLEVVIVGEGDGRTRINLLNLISKYQVEKIVKLMGFQKNVYAVMKTFTVFVFPTRWSLEGFGLVCLEAMMLKIPIVASNFGPVPEVVGDAGILVDPNPQALARGIMQVLTTPKLAQDLVRKGEKRVKRCFDIKNIAQAYEKI